MEVVKAYKDTEIGVIPQDWNIWKLGEISSFSQGIQVDLALQSKVEKPHHERFLRIENYTQKSDDFRYVPVEYGKSKIIDEDDVVVVRYGATAGFIGRGLEGILANNLFKIEPNTKLVHRDFLYRCMVSDRTFKHFQNSMYGGAMPALSFKIVSGIPIPLPPTIAEQAAIATALSDADALISSLEKLITKKRNIKQGAMQQLLQPKEGWVNKKIKEIGLLTGAGVDKTINNQEEPVRLLNYMDVFRRDFIYSNELNHWVTAPSSKIMQCSILMGDIFFTPSSEMRYDIAISAVAKEDIVNAVYSYHLYRFRLLEDWDINFRSYIFKSRDFLKQAEMLCEGSGKRYVISLSKFREMMIWYPHDKSEQSRISTILYDIDLEIAALEAKLEKYKQIKQGMMQQLLTGKIRLV